MLDIGLETLWAEVVQRLHQELTTPSFETWVRATTPVTLEDDVLSLEVPSEFLRLMIATRYQGILKDTVRAVTGRTVDLRLLVSESNPASPPVAPPEPTPVPEKTASAGGGIDYQSRLNPKYVFEAFIVGSSNRFAHAAALAVAEMPARAYNPLFIYGGVGLGKTHLMHAIGHQALLNNAHARVLYVSTENFTNDMINAIRDDRMEQFRRRYRSIDVLLIDDIQFVAGKERTQEEFFHTFEALHGARKQLVISSDRPPKDIPTLEERLRSRFEWGLITDIQLPDLETRVAILAKKAQIDKLSIPDDVLTFIATRIETNIRELEGALIRVMAYSSITRQFITVELAQEALKDVAPISRPKPVTIRMIQEEVARHYDLAMEDFKAKKRTRAVAFPRQVAMYLVRELTDASLPRIGEEFGGRDHTTVMHAYEKIRTDREKDPILAQTLDNLMRRLKAR